MNYKKLGKMWKPLNPECKMSHADLPHWMSLLPSNLMKLISPYQEAFHQNWIRCFDKHNLTLNIFI